MQKLRKVGNCMVLTIFTVLVIAFSWSSAEADGSLAIGFQKSIQYSNNSPTSVYSGGQSSSSSNASVGDVIAFMDLSNSFNNQIPAPVTEQVTAFPFNVTPLYRNGPQNGGGMFPLLDSIPAGDVEALASAPEETDTGVKVWKGREYVYALYKGDSEETEWTAVAKALFAAQQAGGNIKELSTDIHSKSPELNAIYTKGNQVWMAKARLDGIFIKRRLKPEAWGLGLAVGGQHSRLEGNGPNVFIAQVTGAFGYGTSEVKVRPVIMVVAPVTKTAKK